MQFAVALRSALYHKLPVSLFATASELGLFSHRLLPVRGCDSELNGGNTVYLSVLSELNPS